jgi:uncharacterized protein YegL
MSDVNHDDQLKLLPFYLVCDVSISMVQSGALDEVNKILPALVEALERNPIICDKIRFSALDFSDDSRVVLPLCNLLDEPSMPAFEGRGGTSYVAAFNALRVQIENDVNMLKADGFLVHRPAVFFLSDGEPTDNEGDWKNAFHNLTFFDKATTQGFRMYPNVIPFGLVGANPQILQQLIHPTQPANRAMSMFMSTGDERAAANAVAEIAKLLIQSVLASGTGMNAGGGGIVLPPPDPNGPIAQLGADDDLDDLYL